MIQKLPADHKWPNRQEPPVTVQTHEPLKVPKESRRCSKGRWQSQWVFHSSTDWVKSPRWLCEWRLCKCATEWILLSEFEARDFESGIDFSVQHQPDDSLDEIKEKASRSLSSSSSSSSGSFLSTEFMFNQSTFRKWCDCGRWRHNKQRWLDLISWMQSNIDIVVDEVLDHVGLSPFGWWRNFMVLVMCEARVCLVFSRFNVDFSSLIFVQSSIQFQLPQPGRWCWSRVLWQPNAFLAHSVAPYSRAFAYFQCPAWHGLAICGL